MTEDTEVTVIIPTMAEASRNNQIKNAVASIRKSSCKPIIIIVVVNGARFDESVLSWLKIQNDITVEYTLTSASPNAVHLGRSLVKTKYFSTLDDDDEYLPFCTDKKKEVLENDSNAALVVGLSQRQAEGKISVHYSSMERVPISPLIELFSQTWLNSGNALYRTSAISAKYFDDGMSYAEWTWIAYQIALSGKKVAVLDETCHQINVTSGSLSQSNQYVASYLTLFKRMLAVAPPKNTERLIHKKISGYFHANSMRGLAEMRFKEAIYWHFKSLLFRDGLRYIFYTRHIIFLCLFTVPYRYIRRLGRASQPTS